MSPARLRLGTVPYLNALPLVEGLDDRPGIELLRDVPARLVQRLRAGDLDAALVSAVELFRTPRLDWLAGPGVTCRGEVRSIRLYLRTAPEQVQSLALDSSSRSAAVLAVVALHEFLGARVTSRRPAPPGAPLAAIEADAILRIGDPALATDAGDLRVVDLGALWLSRTGLPFVFAAWLLRGDEGQARPELAGLRSTLFAARAAGLAALERLAEQGAAAAGLQAHEALHYLRHCVGHDIGPAEIEGLSLFGVLAHRHGLVDSPVLPVPLA